MPSIAALFYAYIWASLRLAAESITTAEKCPGAPLLSESGLKQGHPYCQPYKYACVDQDTIIVYDPQYADGPRADRLPKLGTETMQAHFRHGKTGARLGKLIGQQFNATEPIVAGTSYQNIPLPIRLAAEHEEGIEGRRRMCTAV